MKRLRLLGLLLCLVSWWFPVGSSLAAQPAASGKAEATQGKAGKPAASAQKKRPKAAAKPARAKSRAVHSKAVATPVPQPKLDLSIPTDMVNELKPEVGGVPQPRKTLLPAMFPDNPGAGDAFQLNGRLISNEMQLQLRNDSQRDVEGAAIEFQFRQ